MQYVNTLPVITNIFKFRAITTEEIKNICKSMKNKSMLQLKLLWITGTKIRNILNMSMRTGVFPNNWKFSMIYPIEQILKTNKCDEFYPINTLKTWEKNGKSN